MPWRASEPRRSRDPAGRLAGGHRQYPAPPPLPAPPPAPPGKHWVPNKGAQDATLPLPSIDMWWALRPLDARDAPPSSGRSSSTSRHLPCRRPWTRSPSRRLPRSCRPTTTTFSELRPIRQAAKILASGPATTWPSATTRRRPAGTSARSWTCAACWSVTARSCNTWSPIACRGLIYAEVTNLSREIGLTRVAGAGPAGAAAIASVGHAGQVARHEPWRMPVRTAYPWMLAYTKGPDGNGWFVPYASQTDDLADRALRP